MHKQDIVLPPFSFFLIVYWGSRKKASFFYKLRTKNLFQLFLSFCANSQKDNGSKQNGGAYAPPLLYMDQGFSYFTMS